jgi:hypothetical protein
MRHPSVTWEVETVPAAGACLNGTLDNSTTCSAQPDLVIAAPTSALDTRLNLGYGAASQREANPAALLRQPAEDPARDEEGT